MPPERAETMVNARGEASLVVPPLPAIPTAFRASRAGISVAFGGALAPRRFAVAPEAVEAASATGRLLVVEVSGAAVVREGWIPLDDGRLRRALEAGPGGP